MKFRKRMNKKGIEYGDYRDRQAGFTLVELLTVMAIIGILAGVIFAGIASSRKRARVSSAAQTAKSAMTEAANCYLRGKSIEHFPVDASGAGAGTVCTGAGAGNWPELNSSCTYGAYDSGANTFTVRCNNNTNTITCDIVNSECSY